MRASPCVGSWKTAGWLLRGAARRSHRSGRYTIGNSRPLQRWTVSTWTAAGRTPGARRAPRRRRPRGLGDAAAQPGRQRGRSRAARRFPRRAAARRRGGGRSAAARRRRREHPCRQPLADRDRLGQRGHALRAQHARPAVERGRGRPPVGVVGGRDALGASSRGTASARRARARGVDAGRSSAWSSRSHSRGGRRLEHAARAGEHGRDAEARRAHRGPARRLGCGARARRRRRAARLAALAPSSAHSISAPDVSSATRSPARSLGDELAGRLACTHAAARVRSISGSSRCDDPHAQRRGVGRAGQPRRWFVMPRAPCGRRSARGRAARRRTARRTRRSGPGRCAS